MSGFNRVVLADFKVSIDIAPLFQVFSEMKLPEPTPVELIEWFSKLPNRLVGQVVAYGADDSVVMESILEYCSREREKPDSEV